MVQSGNEKARALAPCEVCQHPRCADVEARLFEGYSVPAIAREFGVSERSVSRHSKRHIPALVRKGFNTRLISRARSLTQRIEYLLTESVDILEDSRSTHQLIECKACELTFEYEVNAVKDRIAAAGQVSKTLELVGRLTGQIAGPPLQELFNRLGVRNETELREIVDESRASHDKPLELYLDNALALVRWIVEQGPPRRDPLTPEACKQLHDLGHFLLAIKPEISEDGRSLVRAGAGPPAI